MTTSRKPARALIACLALIATACTGGAEPLPCSVRWTAVPAPNPTVFSVLTAVDAVSASDVWAVGGYAEKDAAADANDRLGPLRPLVEHWDGTAWGILPAIRSRGLLVDVSVARANDAWVLPQRGSFVHRWHRHRWARVPLPIAATARLNSIAALSPSDAWIVGSERDPRGRRALMLRWDGRTWRRTLTPARAGSSLEAVGGGAPDDVWAVGSSRGQPFAAHWNGERWESTPIPSSSAVVRLTAVAAASPTVAWAIGIAFGRGGNSRLPVAFRWNGRFWIEADPAYVGHSPTTVSAVTVAHEGGAWIAGKYRPQPFRSAPLLEYFDGTNWSIVQSATAGENATLSDVDVAGDVWAVGYSQPSTEVVTSRTFVERLCPSAA